MRSVGLSVALALAVALGAAGNPLGLVADVLRFSARAAPRPRIAALVCWGQGNMELLRMLSSMGVASTLLEHRALWPDAAFSPSVGPPDLFVVDVACPLAQEFILRADALSLFEDPNRWLLIELDPQIPEDEGDSMAEDACPRYQVEEGELGARFESQYGLQHALVDSQVLLARAVGGDPPTFDLLELYRRAAGQPLAVARVGAWGEGRGICWGAPPALSARRMDLRGLVLPTSMVVTNPESLQHLEDFHDKHIDTITKVDYNLVRLVIHMFNANVEYTVVDTWGYATNGSWSGMVGHLQRGEAEIGGTGLFFLADRIPVIEYVAMTTPTGSAFIFRQPPLSLVSNLFTLPFRGPVWAAAVGLLALTAALLRLAVQWENACEVRLSPDPDRLRPLWGDVGILTLGAVCQQGSPVEPRRVSGRIVSLMLLVFVMCLYTSYAANIVALLQSTTDSIRTLADLLHSRLDLGVWDIVYNRHYFKVANDPVRRALYLKKVVPPGQKPHFLELYEGFRRVRRGMYAFHAEISTGYHIVQRTWTEDEKCGIQQIPFLQFVSPYLAIRKRSPYKELVKMAFRKLRERGLQSRIWRRLVTPKPECLGRGSSFVSVGIVECYPAVLVLVYGLSVALAVLAAESLVYRRLLTRVVHLGGAAQDAPAPASHPAPSSTALPAPSPPLEKAAGASRLHTSDGSRRQDLRSNEFL